MSDKHDRDMRETVLFREKIWAVASQYPGTAAGYLKALVVVLTEAAAIAGVSDSDLTNIVTKSCVSWREIQAGSRVQN